MAQWLNGSTSKSDQHQLESNTEAEHQARAAVAENDSTLHFSMTSESLELLQSLLQTQQPQTSHAALSQVRFSSFTVPMFIASFSSKSLQPSLFLANQSPF